MTGCLLRLILLPASIAALYPLFCLRAPGPTFVLGAEGAEVAAGVAGGFVWWVIISWLDMRQIAADLALSRNWSLRDGERAVVTGRIEGRDRALTAPFSGEKCVGYSYLVTHHSRHATMRTTEWTDYEGFALAPSRVRGPLRTVNVLAPPDAEVFREVPAREITSDPDWERAEAYLANTDFGEKPTGPLADTRTLLIDHGPGNFRENKQVKDPPKNLRHYKPVGEGGSITEGQRRLTEAIVRDGDEVTIAGVYRAEGDGIAPDPDSIMRPLHIVVGGEAPLRQKIRNRIVGMAVAGTAAAATAAVYFLVVVPRNG